MNAVLTRLSLAAGMALATLIPLPLPALADTLSEALVSAYGHAALLDQNRAVLRAADEDVAIAVARLRPVLQWTASHNFRETAGVETQSTTLSLGAQMTLYDWGRGALAIDGAKEVVLATRQALLSVEQDVLLAAIRAYFTVRAAAERAALTQNSVRLVGQLQQAARDRFDVGEVTVTDVALAEAQLAATRAQLASAEGELAVAREGYLAATGRRPGTLAAPPPLPKRPDSVDAARALAQRNHPAIRQAQHQTAAAEIGVAAAAAERSPRLTGNLGASVTRAPGALGQTEDRAGLSAGIELSQTLGAGGLLSAQHRRAMAQRDQARAALTNLTWQVGNRVGEAWANIDVARAQITAIDEQIRAAQQAYDGVREEVTLGARTTLDALDAEQSLLTARADKISAEANLQLAHYQLLAAMGLLTVEHLKLGIPTYDPTAYYRAVRDAPFTSKQGENLDRVLRALGRD